MSSKALGLKSVDFGGHASCKTVRLAKARHAPRVRGLCIQGLLALHIRNVQRCHRDIILALARQTEGFI